MGRASKKSEHFTTQILSVGSKFLDLFTSVDGPKHPYFPVIAVTIETTQEQ